jgi:DNA mismatch repair protein MutS
MMEQYFSIKSQHPDAILMFRLGDFFEMFHDDAKTASRVLDIALTARGTGESRTPMCGVPAHAVEAYVSRLVAAGHRVAMCDQVEDAKASKGLVKRDVTRIVTAGTVTDDAILRTGEHNLIVSIFAGKKGSSMATADITTGHFICMAFAADEQQKLVDELSRLSPAELIIPDNFPIARVVETITACTATRLPAYMFAHATAFSCLTAHFKTLHLQGFGIADNAPEIPAAGALLAYIQDTQRGALPQITALMLHSRDKFMVLDAASRRNLELTEARGGGKRGSLLGVLDHTRTAMGARLLRGWISAPLLNADDITRRLDAVGEWKSMPIERGELREILSEIRDMERIMARLSTPRATARDLAALRASMQLLPAVARVLAFAKAHANDEMRRTFDDLSDIFVSIEATITEMPPATVREGGMIRRGRDHGLDELHHTKLNAQAIIAEMETREREATGISSLKIRVNKVFGYYIEVSAANLQKVPPHYIRKQTIAGGERFITQELKNLEETLQGADEKIAALEHEIYDALRRETLAHMSRVQFTSAILASLDALQSLAHAADLRGYTRPAISRGYDITIKEGRHPVVEATSSEMRFVPNDTHLAAHTRMGIITGPNMAGKSTYMRQVALITLMAQVGSFVPADLAEIGIVDRIFTRVGASDDLATGQSTFMVEMTEVAAILHTATENSLILLDEIGRGTSTYDGLSIAWAVLSHIAAALRAKTLFATHYHELSQLEGREDGVANFCFTAEEQGDAIVFLRRLMRGSAGKSYGIHVAQLAGIPGNVISTAQEKLAGFTQG